jgi:hypothetical protein
VVTSRDGIRGISKLGCLLSLLVIVTVVYFGLSAGEVYFRYLKFKDAMAQEVRFRGDLSDESIKARLRSVADSLGLPEEAGNITVTRDKRVVHLRSRYYDVIELPGFHREILFEPRADGVF